MTILFQVKRDSASAWNLNNPTLLSGELGWDITNQRLKVGNGSTAWNSLSYSTFNQSDLDAKLNISASSNFLLISASSNFLPITASSNYLPISASSNFATVTIATNAQTGTSYTLTASDSAKIIEMNNAAANLVIIPLNSSVPFPIGTQIEIVQTGAGATSASIVSGVTLNSEGGKRTINAQWQSASLIKRGTDSWMMIGAIKA